MASKTTKKEKEVKPKICFHCNRYPVTAQYKEKGLCIKCRNMSFSHNVPNR